MKIVEMVVDFGRWARDDGLTSRMQLNAQLSPCSLGTVRAKRKTTPLFSALPSPNSSPLL